MALKKAKFKTQYQLTLQDIKEAYGTAWRKAWYRLWLLCFAVMGLVVFAKINFKLSFSLWMVLLGIAFVPVLLPIFWGRNRAEQVWKANPGLQETHKFFVFDEGVQWRTKHGQMKQLWSEHSLLEETEHLLLLYTNEKSYQILPKRAFSEENLNVFLAMIGEQPQIQQKRWKAKTAT